MKKKILCLLLALLVINLSIPHVAWAADEKPTSGNCGVAGKESSVKWAFDDVSGTLTISGSGEMKDYFPTDRTPWYEHIENIKSVIIKSGVKSIGGRAFQNCTGLTSVTIPNGVTQIEYRAFENCTNLESVTIPDSVNYIGGNAFYGTKWLDQQREQNGPLVVVNNILIDGKAAEGEVSIPEDVTSIVGCVFKNCTGLTSVTIPESVTHIGDEAFKGCRKLTSAIILSRVTRIGYSAFESCTSLESVTIPAGVKEIKSSAFENCTGLTSVTIPNSVTQIEIFAFENCTSLKSVTIPESVTFIGGRAFQNCTGLKTVFYKEGLNIESAGIPDQTAKIGYIMHDQQDGPRTKVKLVKTSENVTIKCDAMGDGYEIIDNATDGLEKEVTITHDWNAGTVTTEPTCTKDGTKSYTCNACGAMKDETIKAAGHKFSPEWSSNDTHHWHECSACYEKQNEEKHTFEQKSDEGKHWEECNVCHEKQNEGQHTFEQKSDSTKHWKVCSICKEVTERGRHNFIEDTIGAMENKLGGTKCTCTDCGYVYWKDFKRGDNMATQIFMPNDEKIHLYCERNGLAAETTVEVGGKTLRVFLLDPLRVLKKNDSNVLGISVTYIKEGSARYDELMSLLDGDYPIEHINFFEVLPTVNGKIKDGPIDSVYMMYEIPEGWDESDLEMILVQNGDDQEFDEEVVEMNGKKYLVMWKNHFSPYAMIDKLTDEERAALIAQQVESMGSANSSGSTDNSKCSANQVKTGDNSMSTVLMSTAMLITSGLFLEVCIKKKRFCYKISTD